MFVYITWPMTQTFICTKMHLKAEKPHESFSTFGNPFGRSCLKKPPSPRPPHQVLCILAEGKFVSNQTTILQETPSHLVWQAHPQHKQRPTNTQQYPSTMGRMDTNNIKNIRCSADIYSWTHHQSKQHIAKYKHQTVPTTSGPFALANQSFNTCPEQANPAKFTEHRRRLLPGTLKKLGPSTRSGREWFCISFFWSIYTFMYLLRVQRPFCGHRPK